MSDVVWRDVDDATWAQWSPPPRWLAAVNATHPGFTVMCDACGSTVVLVDDARDEAPDDPDVWGGVSLVCECCGQRSEVAAS